MNPERIETMTLTEFLLERIAEDEDVAIAAAGWEPSGRERSPGRWRRSGLNSVVDDRERLVVYGDGPAPSDGQTDHIARHDPARVLAECAADRTIVEMHAPAGRDCEFCVADIDMWGEEVRYETYPCPTLRLLAAIYADHPHYLEEWRP